MFLAQTLEFKTELSIPISGFEEMMQNDLILKLPFSFVSFSDVSMDLFLGPSLL